MKVELKPTILLKWLKSFKEPTWQLGFYEIIPFEAGYFQVYNLKTNEYISHKFEILDHAKKYLNQILKRNMECSFYSKKFSKDIEDFNKLNYGIE